MMLLARIPLTCLVVLLTSVSAFAADKQRPESPPRVETCEVDLGVHKEALRFVAALEVLAKNHPRCSEIALHTGRDGTVRITAPVDFLDHLGALTGYPAAFAPPPKEKRARGPKGVRGKELQERPRGRARERRGDRPPGPRRDVDVPRRGGRPEKLEVRVFELMFADARELVKYVDMLRIGSPAPWATAFDERTNSIIVKGPPELVDQAADLTGQLDRPADREGESALVMKLMPLSHADARQLAGVVEHVLRAGRRGPPPPVEVVPDRRTNTIVLAGPEHLVMRASDLIRELDGKSRAAKKKKGEAKGGKPKAAAAPKPPKKAKDQAKPLKEKKAKKAKKAKKRQKEAKAAGGKKPKAPANPAPPKKPKGGKKTKRPGAKAPVGQPAEPVNAAADKIPPGRDI